MTGRLYRVLRTAAWHISSGSKSTAHHIGDEQDGQAKEGGGNSVDTDLAAKDPEADGDRQRTGRDLLVARQRAQLLQLLPGAQSLWIYEQPHMWSTILSYDLWHWGCPKSHMSSAGTAVASGGT